MKTVIDLEHQPKQVVNRLLKLKEYESTGLTPKEIERLKENVITLKTQIESIMKLFVEKSSKAVEEEVKKEITKTVNTEDYLKLEKMLNKKNFKNNFNIKP